jgi:2-polyprenyl-3-methyl-5-hydroxy-6-metoxy-1,4-benzoquinol methylase
VKHCPLCNSTKRTLLYPSTLTKIDPTLNQYLCTSSSYGIHGPIYKCLNCNFIFIVDNAPITNILKSYEKAEDPVYIAEEPGRRKTFSRHLKALAKLRKEKGKLLDIGSYTGLFLSMAKEDGWETEGIEPSRWAVEQAKKIYNLSIKNSILKPGIFKPNTFDVVTMWDVIEHFANPKQSVEISHTLLKPGGLLAITTIDVDSFPAQILKARWPWFMRMHRVYFSRKTLKKLLEENGFKVIAVYPHIRIISLKYFLSRFNFPPKKYKNIFRNLARITGAKNIFIPFYIGDLFDMYAQKI